MIFPQPGISPSIHGDSGQDQFQGRVQYLQKCLKERLLTATDMTAKSLLEAFQDSAGGAVQLLVRGWYDAIAFEQYGMLSLLRMVEDLIRTVRVLARADLSQISSEYVRRQIRCKSLDATTLCTFKYDSAENLVLEILHCPADREPRDQPHRATRDLAPIRMPPDFQQLVPIRMPPNIQHPRGNDDGEEHSHGEGNGVGDDDSTIDGNGDDRDNEIGESAGGEDDGDSGNDDYELSGGDSEDLKADEV